MNREQIDEILKERDMSLLLMDGFDEACIGFTYRINEPETAVYSHELMVQILMDRDGMDYEEADEYISFNCAGAWVGERTPHIVYGFVDN
jgi:hypothetical protein